MTGWNVDAAFTQAATLVAQRQKDAPVPDIPPAYIDVKPDNQKSCC